MKTLDFINEQKKKDETIEHGFKELYERFNFDPPMEEVKEKMAQLIEKFKEQEYEFKEGLSKLDYQSECFTNPIDYIKS